MNFDFLWLLIPAGIFLFVPMEIKGVPVEVAQILAIVWVMTKVLLVVAILGAVAIVGTFGGFNG